MEFDLLEVKKMVETLDYDQPTGDPFIDGWYEKHREEFGSPLPYWRMFYWLCKKLRPRLTVELGAWQATCAAHMAACREGMVYTIDHHTDPGDEVHREFALEADGQYPNLNYLRGWTWDVADQVPSGIDILFIDSWHHYDKAMKDWDAYRPKLSVPALVVGDDICNMPPILYNMVEFWTEISEGREAYIIDNLNPGYPTGFMKWEG